MISKTALCNLALQAMGQRTSLVNVDTDTGMIASELKRAFDTARDATLRGHDWNFALAQAVLAADGTAPPFGFAYRYAWPSGCLRVTRFSEAHHGRRPLWRNIGRFIHTDLAAPLYIEYVATVTDTGQCDPLFELALAARLAAMTGVNITGKDSLAREMEQLYDKRIADARWADAIDSGRAAPEDGEYLASRTAG